MNHPESSGEGAIPVAGDGEVYSLKWHTFHSHFTNGLKNLFLEADPLTDVTLSSEGRYIRTHKLLLSLCSPYFKHMFQVNQVQNASLIVVLNNVKFKDLENIVHFIYNGEVKVKNTDLSGFLQTGELLQIEGLGNCASGESKNADSSNLEDQSQPQNSQNNGQTMAGGHSQSMHSSLQTSANPVRVQVPTPSLFPIRVHPHHKSAHRSVKRAKYTVQSTGRSLHVPVTSAISGSYNALNTSGGNDMEMSGGEIETDPLALHEEVNPLMNDPLEDHGIRIDSIKSEDVGQSGFMNENDGDFEATEPRCMSDVGDIFTSSLSMNEGVNSLPGPSSAISGAVPKTSGLKERSLESQSNSNSSLAEDAKKYRFLDKVFEIYSQKGHNTRLIRRFYYDSIIKQLTTEKSDSHKRAASYYQNVKRYDIVNDEGNLTLVKKGTLKRIVAVEDIYAVLHSAHQNTRHGGRDSMIQSLKANYSNVSRQQICIYLDLCERCRLRKTRYRKPMDFCPNSLLGQLGL